MEEEVVGKNEGGGEEEEIERGFGKKGVRGPCVSNQFRYIFAPFKDSLQKRPPFNSKGEPERSLSFLHSQLTTFPMLLALPCPVAELRT